MVIKPVSIDYSVTRGFCNFIKIIFEGISIIMIDAIIKTEIIVIEGNVTQY
jgi:hypothetical protein